LCCRAIWPGAGLQFPLAGRGRHWRSEAGQADKHSNAGMLRERFKYYCEKVVKGFYKDHFLRFDRQIVLVDCLQPLNSGPQAFNDMRLALTQLMSFHYGQRTLFRRLFSPVIDKLLFAATKADHVTVDQHGNMVRCCSS
jgi:predicted YcjX-like family ATPase